MPAVSSKQARYMQMCLHNPGAAKTKCPPPEVAKEFSVMKHNHSAPKVGTLYTHKRRNNIA